MDSIEPGVLDQLARDILDTIFLVGEAPCDAAGGPPVASWIHLRGQERAWVVSVELSEHLLRCTTATIFGHRPSEVTWNQMKATLAEIANMLGGNIKGISGKFHTLSLPSTVERMGEKVAFPGTSLLVRSNLDYRNGWVEICILESTESALAV
jgi:hypothetical protein